VRGEVLLNETGRLDKAYGQPCAERLLEHQVLITDVELLVGPLERRAKVGKALPDGYFVFRGTPFAVECDNHTMTAKQMRKKWSNYEGFGGIILVVCRTKGRLRRLMQGASLVRHLALFTLVRWLRSNRRPWIDLNLKRSCTPVRVV
jgi:hypothetical protein